MKNKLSDGEYHYNMHTRELTRNFARARAWHDDGFRVLVIRIRTGEPPFIWEYI